MEKDQLDMVHEEGRNLLHGNLDMINKVCAERDKAVVDLNTMREKMRRQCDQHMRAMSDMMARISERPQYLPGSGIHQNLIPAKVS